MALPARPERPGWTPSATASPAAQGTADSAGGTGAPQWDQGAPTAGGAGPGARPAFTPGP